MDPRERKRLRDRDYRIRNRERIRVYRASYYQRRKTTGSGIGTRIRPSLADRFWAKVRIGAPDECWEWTAGRASNGYGNIYVEGGNSPRFEKAHRAAWMLTHGPISPGLVVRHHCDNRGCVNPAHLEIGTHLDNMRDAVERGRTSHIPRLIGIQHPRAKLTDSAVIDIRHRRVGGESAAALAEEFGVSRSLIWQVARGALWRHIA